MARIQRTTKGGSSSQVIAEGAGIDPTGKEDSTTGLLESYQKAINKNKDWYVPAGTYLIGEGGKGFDISTLTWPATTQSATAIAYPPKILCGTTCLFRGHPSLKTNPVVALKSPQTAAVEQLAEYNFNFGRITGPSVHAVGALKISSKIVTGMTSTKFLELFVGQPVESNAGIPGGTTLAKIVSSTEVELSAEATITEAQNIRFGPTYEAAALYVGPGMVDGSFFVQGLEESLYGCLCESKEASAEIKVGWVANNSFIFQFLGNCQYGLYLKSPAKGPSFGVQGNRFQLGETIGGNSPGKGKWGIVVDEAVNQNSRFNKFEFSVIESTTEGGILDRNGSTNFVGNYLGTLVPTSKKNYVFAEGAVGIPYVRGFMEEGFEAPGHEGVDLISYKEPVGFTGASIPGATGGAVRNAKARPLTAVVQLTPKATSPNSGSPIGSKEIKIVEGEAKGWIIGKPVTFSAVPTGSNFQTGIAYYIVKSTTQFGTLSEALSTAANIEVLKTNALLAAIPNEAKFWIADGQGHNQEWKATAEAKAGATEVKVTSQKPSFAFPAGLTRLESGGFILAKEPGGAEIEVTGAELTSATTKFSTPNLRFQLTGNTEIGQTVLQMRGTRAKGFSPIKTGTYPRFMRFTRVTSGVSSFVAGTTYFGVIGEIEPTEETPIGKTEIHLKETGGVEAQQRFPNGTLVQFTKVPAGSNFKTGTNYFVVEAAKELFKLALTEGGAAIEATGAALTPAETLLIRPNNFELAATEGGTPIKIAGAKLEAATTEVNPALASVEKSLNSLLEGEGLFPVAIPVNSQWSLGIYNAAAALSGSLGT